MACFASTLGVIILYGFITLSAANKDICDLYAAVGQTLILPFDYKALATTDELRWTHNSTIIFYRQPGRVSVGKPEDISATGSLQLKNLMFSSAGIYKADVLSKNATFLKGWTGRLCMMEKVSKPQVNFVCDPKGIVTLTCHVAKPQGLLFTWTLDEKTLKSETRQTLSISLTQLKGENNFTCGVANKVSKEISNSVRLTCKGSEPAAPTFCFRRKTVMATLAGGACLILLLLIIIIILCCRHRRNKTVMSLGDKGKVRMTPLNQERNSIVSDYEIMHPTPTPSPKPPPRANDQAVSQYGQEESLQVSRAADKQPSPVPKPRMKTPQTQGI